MALERGVKFEWHKNDITYYTHKNFTAADENAIDVLVAAHVEVEKENDRNATFVQSTKIETRTV